MTVRDPWTGRKPWRECGFNSAEKIPYLGGGIINRSKEEIPIAAIVPPFRYSARQHLLKQLRHCRTASLNTR
jgi:hypothetical protein